MKKYTLFPLLFIGLFLFPQLNWADTSAEFNAAVAAYDRKDYKTAFDLLTKLANQGDSGAQNNLGVMYHNGIGAAQDDKKAVYWYQKAAEQGHASAQNNLGVMYLNGIGIVQDDIKAANWYQKAADQGLADAQFNLGVLYANGIGVIQSNKRAVHWYQRAANQGLTDAQYNLGVMYYHGRGAPKNKVVSYALVRTAAVSNSKARKAQKKISIKMSWEELTAGRELSDQMIRPGNLLPALNEYLKKHS
ncbi:tetratricopeptide repeat protein [Candidatus Nitrosacidococcus sp. I8]|uniref:tetratricopeptide repeat protein n=1 Tax=Candidatus Nitrosacidococcus sp. I8 TaxID=2942908 RepID=UPI00222640E9|nr:tetratricopeptide repeat protein [Candidatus Nitrosacidococcus sp. I8]CAH9019263.1 hypothetical protein NURINAE_01431 [Candidatus Nitrosacidococcus sp. I8]